MKEPTDEEMQIPGGPPPAKRNTDASYQVELDGPILAYGARRGRHLTGGLEIILEIMKRLTNWIRARLFARRWAVMREAAAYRPSASAWDYHPRRR